MLAIRCEQKMTIPQESTNPIVFFFRVQDHSEMDNPNITDDMSINSDDDFDEEEGDGNLNEREIQEIHSMLDRSELGNQGFIASEVTTPDGKPEPSPHSKWEHVKSIDFNGRSFHVGRCYNYLKPNAASSTLIWIWEFASEETCFYAEARSANDETFLGIPFEPGAETKLVNETLFEKERAMKLPMTNVKIVQEKPLYLGHLQEEVLTPDVIPEWTYIRRCKNKSLRFGYIYQPMTNPPTRMGLRKKDIRVLELFSGAGLMHQGFKNIPGFKTVAAVELDELACKTFKLNHPGVPVFNENVRTFLDKCKDPKFRKKLGTIDVLHASPPCQGFSSANIGGGQFDEANNDLSLIWIDFIHLSRPLVATFENVGGMWRGKHLHYLRFILKELLSMGYQFRMDVLYAGDNGDPQARPRLIIFASQKHILLPQLPQPAHGNKGSGLCPYVTVSDALEGVGFDKNDPSDGLPGTSLDRDDRNVIVLEPNKLAPTMRARGPPVWHYKFNRCIGVREYAALFSVPREFRLLGTTREKIHLIGNGVPVCMATAIVRAVWESLRFEYHEEASFGPEH
jgi:DNA (cytosine-5)-methyltransferase 1